jgi:glycosyltransferase involved in cell wall biosynthesis
MRIMFLGEGGVSDSIRCMLPAEYLNRIGFGEAIVQALPLGGTATEVIRDVDVVIYSRPHHIELINAYKETGAKIIVDMDDDFHTIPKKHPGYPYVGWGNPVAIQLLERSIGAADLLTVTTPQLGDRLQKFNTHPYKVIPNGWSSHNELWGRKYEHDTVNIGWSGTITHKADFGMCRNSLIEMAIKHENVKIYIGGDFDIYEMLSTVREDQKVYIPMLPYEDYPHALGYLDIWLAPLQNTEFNNAKSDIKLVDAGAKGIPFIASPAPFYVAWGGGGAIASEKMEWLWALDTYITDVELREKLGKAGRELANEREMSVLVNDWVEAIEEALA